MSDPTEPLMRWLREQIVRKGENTASIANRLGKPRGEVRRLLAGEEPMSLADFLAISGALELKPEDFGLATLPDEDVSSDDADHAEEAAHWRNQPEALVRFAFDHGIDVQIVCDVGVLRGLWGGPDAVLDAFEANGIPIGLDAAYHRFMEPDYDDDGFHVSVGFDRLYRCFLPWRAMTRIVFTPFLPAAPKKPTLRLVT